MIDRESCHILPWVPQVFLPRFPVSVMSGVLMTLALPLVRLPLVNEAKPSISLQGAGEKTAGTQGSHILNPGIVRLRISDEKLVPSLAC